MVRIEEFENDFCQKVGTDKFLELQGLINEVPFFIQHYHPQQEDAIYRSIETLTRRLQNEGIDVFRVDLFDLWIESLEEKGILASLIEGEKNKDYSKDNLFETLSNFAAPADMAKKLNEAVNGRWQNNDATHKQLVFISGSGRMHPFLQTHALLESLQIGLFRCPHIIFYPGKYSHDKTGGSRLRLFATDSNPVELDTHRGYYRAFDLELYQP